jgi:two-component system NtrC family sensor kinase
VRPETGRAPSQRMSHSHKEADRSPEDFRNLSHRILLAANAAGATVDFLRDVCEMIAVFTGSDVVEVRVRERDKCTKHELTIRPEKLHLYRIIECPSANATTTPEEYGAGAVLEFLSRDIMLGRYDARQPFFTANGTFWAGSTRQAFSFRPHGGEPERTYNLAEDGGYATMALIPLSIGTENLGLLTYKSRLPNLLSAKDVAQHETVAQNLALALAHHRTHCELRERVKELACLFRITRYSSRRDMPLRDVLQSIVELLPPALHHTDVAHARLVFDGVEYTTPGFREGQQRLSATVIVSGERAGLLEALYSEPRPELDEGPFLDVERKLIDTIAHEVSLVIEQKRTERESQRLQHQLLHADRLATIGQLAAGVAHELNEPLGGIIGFAQLAMKEGNLSEQASADVEKIVKAGLHAREVIKKLMLFARQQPTRRLQVNLNDVVRDGLYFLESRCVTSGIHLKRELQPDLPAVMGDPAQLHQVLVNLVVNAIQAMPEGGFLTVQTLCDNDHVLLRVEDSGTGIPQDVLENIFLPFFTTKDVGQGTGLGLAVVHGIVTSHGGTVKAESELGRGSCFEIHLPATPAGNGESVENAT